MLKTNLSRPLVALISDLGYNKAILLDFIHKNSNKGFSCFRSSITDIHNELKFIDKDSLLNLVIELNNDGLVECLGDYCFITLGNMEKDEMYQLKISFFFSKIVIEKYYISWHGTVDEYYCKGRYFFETEFIFDDKFQYIVSCIGFPKALLLKFIDENTNRGNEYVKINNLAIKENLYCLSETLISRSLRELEQSKIIKSKIGGKNMFDRTKSYTLDEKSLKYLDDYEYHYSEIYKIGLDIPIYGNLYSYSSGFQANIHNVEKYFQDYFNDVPF